MTYFFNLPEYPFFKPQGNDGGYNVCCIALHEYVGFDDDYRRGPQSLEDIAHQAFLAFIDPDDVEEKHDLHLKMSQGFARDPSSFLNQFFEAQENSKFYQFFDFQKIRAFLQTREIEI